MLQGLLGGFAAVLEPTNLVLVFLGTALGLVVGALPGFSSPMAIVVLLPLTYRMPALSALVVMMGVYVGTKLGGSFPAILLRTPGTPAAACTALDGYPMAENGEAGRALGLATMGSTFGSLFGWVMAIVFVPLLSLIAIRATNADIAMIGILGLIMVSAFLRGSMLRGAIGVLVGLLIATIGLDPITAVGRFTFGQFELISGIPFAAALVGFFGITVVLSDLGMIGKRSTVVATKVNLALPGVAELKRYWSSIVIGGLYGVAFGAVPGVGAEASPWMSYATVRNRSKHPERFGTGEAEGIVAPEATNNANNGGTLVPMLTLGIPGDGSTAVMLGALILHGVTPGVRLMQTDGTLVYGILASLLISTVFMFLIAWKAIRYFIVVLQQDRGWLFPYVLVLATLGAFSSMNSMFPVYVAIFFGVVGFVFEKSGFPVVTIVLGIILGPIIEQNVRVALALSNNGWLTFVDSPLRIVIASVIVGLIGLEVLKGVSRMRSGMRLRQRIVDEEVV
jgi:putative tricarboxylic transport membrane protein